MELVNVIQALKSGGTVRVKNKSKGFEIISRFEGSESDVEILIAGGYLNYMEVIRKGRCS
ncbi:MAG: hypothetical protein K0R80_1516 [Clostridia bacterium]|nr:hypothetical protein [Clostridia bacterium]